MNAKYQQFNFPSYAVCCTVGKHGPVNNNNDDDDDDKCASHSVHAFHTS